MIELILIVLLAWRIYHMAVEKGLSAWRWVSNFLSGYFAFGIIVSFIFIYVYGKDSFKDFSTLQQKLTPWSPFVLLFLIVWFMFLRSRILKKDNSRYEEMDEDDHQSSEPMKAPVPEKKDLSYFR